MKNTAGIHWHGFLPLIREKAPLFALAGISSCVTYVAQNKGGSVSSLDVLPVGSRIVNAVTAYAAYLWNMIWPLNLAVFYPYPGTFDLLVAAGSFFLLLIVSISVIMSAARLPFLLTGWLWYLGTLVPVIGIVQVGYQSMADRYTYVPLIGMFIMIVWGVGYLFDRYLPVKHAGLPFFVVIILLLAWASSMQTRYWKDSITLFSHALEVTRDNYLAHTNLAAALYEKKDIEGVVRHSKEALMIKPDYVPAHCNLGLGLMAQGRYQEAIGHYRESIRINPYYTNGYLNLGGALYKLDRVGEAGVQFQEVLRLKPQHAGALKALGLVREKMGMIEGVIARMNETLKTDPQSHDIHYRLAGLYRRIGDRRNSVAHYERALSIRPGSGEILHALAVQYAENGEYDMALSTLRKMSALKPDDPDVYYNMTCIYSRQGRTDDAIGSLKTALAKGFKDWNAVRTDPDLENIRGTESYRNLAR